MAKYVAWDMILFLKENEYPITDQAKSTLLDIVDRFTVHIPYSNTHIKVRFLLNSLAPASPPDLVLLDLNFSLGLSYRDLSLKWSPMDRSSLLNICERIKREYWAYSNRSFQEISSAKLDDFYNLIRANPCSGEEIDIHIEEAQSRIYKVVFSFILPIQLINIQCKRRILCHIIAYPEHLKFTVELEYPEWAQSLHQYTVSHIYKFNSPHWHFQALETVLQEVLEYLHEAVEQTEDPAQCKGLFLNYLLERNIGIPIEVSEDMTTAQFYIEYQKMTILEPIMVWLKFPDDFPLNPPVSRLTSLRHLVGMKPFELSFKPPAWKPSLSLKQKGESFLKSLKTYTGKFIKSFDSEKPNNILARLFK